MQIESRRFAIVLDSSRDRLEEKGETLLRTLDELAVQTRANGQRLALMIIPDELQVSPELVAEIATRLEITENDFDLDYPQRWLTGYLREADIPYLDLLPAFRLESKTRRLYWPRNTHWNEEGHRLAGELLASFLVDEGLVSAEGPWPALLTDSLGERS